jgi:hypothetical protein
MLSSNHHAIAISDSISGFGNLFRTQLRNASVFCSHFSLSLTHHACFVSAAGASASMANTGFGFTCEASHHFLTLDIQTKP